MRYKIISTYKKPPCAAADKHIKRCARLTRCAHTGPCSSDLPVKVGDFLPSEKETVHVPSDISDLFGFGGFYDPYTDTRNDGEPKGFARTLKTARLRAFVLRLKLSMERQKETIVSKIRAARERRAARLRRASPLPMLCGALCAIFCIFALSLGVVGYRFLLKDRLLRFEKVSIPALVGQNYEETLLDGELFDVTLNYEYDSDVPEGTVIEQTPSAGMIRRVYRGGAPCRVTLTLSLGERYLSMNNYTAMSQRDACLDLKNKAVKFKITEKYSDTVAAGRVISTTPSAGASFSAEEEVTLVVSLGRERKYVALPDLLGLNEVKAREVLEALGFEVGDIRYVSSQMPSGTVVGQGTPAYSLSEIGAKVDMSVSAGLGFSEKKVPDLYGLTVDEARERLALVGLVCGQIYHIQSGGGVATVVSQSIAAGTPITSGIVSVDIYLSS